MELALALPVVVLALLLVVQVALVARAQVLVVHAAREALCHNTLGDILRAGGERAARRRDRAGGHHDAGGGSHLIARSRRAAACLSSGSLRLPHLGDCTHDGHPVSHSHCSSVSRVAASWASVAS